MLGQLPLLPLNRKVLIHTPCSARRLAGTDASVAELLRQIPNADLQTLPNTGCCGAAGSYLLMQPKMADNLRQATLEQIRQQEQSILVTTNTGCALHLAAGLGLSHDRVDVMHPVRLIAQQLR